jgi:hypothetical protein
VRPSCAHHPYVLGGFQFRIPNGPWRFLTAQFLLAESEILSSLSFFSLILVSLSFFSGFLFFALSISQHP